MVTMSRVSKTKGLQLELDDNGPASQNAELCCNIVTPILKIPTRPPLGGHPQPVFSFGILHPSLPQCGV